MSIAAAYWKHAELALAAYGNLLPGDLNITELRRIGMSATQAFRFAASWRVVDQHSDLLSGLSVTVFEDLTNSKCYLSIRGTEPTDAGDIGTDLFIVFTGYEVNLSAQYRQLKAKVGEWLADGTLQPGFTVSGHSLGGFLATGLVADFSASISHAYLYNAPGLNGVLGGATAPILQAFGITAPVDALKISNIKADAGLSPIAGLGAQVAPPIWIGIEDQFLSDVSNPPPARNHAQEVLADALAIYAAYNTLMPTLTVESMTAIFRAASVKNKVTLESALDALRVMVVGNMQDTEEGNRDAFYSNLYALRQDDRYKALAGVATIHELSGLNPETLAAQAKENFGSFLALNYLLPFAIDAATEMLSQAHPDLYAAWLESREKRASGQVNAGYSDQWLIDRATLLLWKDEYFSADGQVVLRGGNTETYIFESRSLDEPDLSLTVVGRQRLSVINPAWVVFGSAGSETLTGSDLNIGDRLYAGDGDDTLIAGGGNDYLEGGKGFDTYIIEAGSGFNWILDTDGAGRIVIDGMQAGDGYKISDNLYISGDKQYEYYFDGDLAVSGTLFINGDVQIDGFRNGDLGINLINEDAISAIQPTVFSVLTDNIIEWGTESADFYFWGMPNNYIPGGEIFHDLVFLGFGGNDLVTSISDVSYEYDSSPSFYGGEGDDVLYTNSHYGHVVGGSGRDIIVGGAGNDYLYGDSEFESFTFFAYTPGDFEFYYRFGRNFVGIEPSFYYAQNVGQYRDGETGDAYGDDIYFEDGIEGVLRRFGMISSPGDPDGNNDYMSGGAGNDVIYGGAGNDISYGGTGNDELYGNNNVDGVYNASLSYLPDYELSKAIRALFYEAGDDFLDGGEGNDKVIDSDGGSDYLLGGEGDDLLMDSSLETVVTHSVNYLDGGAGNDVLVARNPSSERFDILIGGEGNDYLEIAYGRGNLQGGPGNDIYRINSYWLPLETIINNFDTEGFDTLILPTSYLLSQSDQSLLLTRDEENLYIGHPEQLYTVTVLNWFSGQEYKIDRIVFDDSYYYNNQKMLTGMSLDIEAVEAMFRTGSAGSDFLWGSLGNDHLLALAGDDYLNGDAGDDVLEGGEGNDTYVFNTDSGWDTIVDATGENDALVIHGVMPDNVFVIRAEDQFQLFLGSLQRGINIQWQPESGYAIESIQFDDGTTWDALALESVAIAGSVPLPVGDAPPVAGEQEQLTETSTQAISIFSVDNHANGLAELGNLEAANFIPSPHTSFAASPNDAGMNLSGAVMRVGDWQTSVDEYSIVSRDSGHIEKLIADWFVQNSRRAPLEGGAYDNADLDLGYELVQSSPQKIAAAWNKIHEQLDYLARYDGSSSELGASDLQLGLAVGNASDSRYGLQGLAMPGISGHGLPIFSRPFEGLREGLVQIV